MLAFFTFVMATCEEVDEPSCEDTAQPEITRGFSIDVYIYYSDTVPWEGLVTMKFHKEYCSGKISGEYTFTDFCDSDGNYYPDAIPTYKFANSLDKVFIDVSVTGNDNYFADYQEWYVYEDVKPLLLGVEETYVLYLPWTSLER